MPVEENSSLKNPEIHGTMVHRLESNSTWRHPETSDVPKEKMPSPVENQHLKPRVQGKAPNPTSYPCLNPCEQLLGYAVCERKVLGKSSEDHQKPCAERNTSEDEEVIRYMSKLPDYLQQLDKGKNIQGRALHYGVLDWKRLEKWKYNERMPGRCQSKVPSSSTTSLSMANRWPAHPIKSPQRKQSHPCRLHVNSPHSEKFSGGTPLLRGNSLRVQGSQDGCCGETGAEPKLAQGRLVFTERNSSRSGFPKSKWKELDEKPISVIKAFSVDKDEKLMLHTSGAQHGKKDAGAGKGDDLDHRHLLTEPQSIALLLPKRSSKLCCEKISQHSKFRSSSDRQISAMNDSISSDCFSPIDLHFEEFESIVPHTCPLPKTDAISHPITSTKSQRVNTAYLEAGRNSASFPKQTPSNPGIVDARTSSASLPNEDHPISVEPFNKIDLEFAEPVVSGRHPSPNRRFSFSLGRIGRSFSFKDNSAVPQLVSTYTSNKSAPSSSETSVATDHCNREKSSVSARGRSSPIRRLLEPLMKTRGSHSAEAVRPSAGSKYSPSLKPMNTNGLIQVSNQESSVLRALLQLTIKNGLPFFKLVIDNSSDILAAAVKNTPKVNLSLTYAFYSVHEIRKKNAGWMSHGSKSKTSSFGYNTVGQMTISNSYRPDINGKGSKSVCQLTESVLYDVDPRKENIKATACLTSREVAAIIIENPAEKVDEGRQCNEDSLVNFIGCSTIENTWSTTVILPSGLHGVPDKGGPSSLINRWRSGGSCDCGGWDVGCKLRVLTNQELSSDTLMSPKCPDSFKLFSQDGLRESSPILSLAPLRNGLYSVEFNTSISLLEAFSVCVAVITTRKFSDILELKIPSEVKGLSEDDTKEPLLNQGRVPAKYVTIPPPSPVGRI